MVEVVCLNAEHHIYPLPYFHNFTLTKLHNVNVLVLFFVKIRLAAWPLLRTT